MALIADIAFHQVGMLDQKKLQSSLRSPATLAVSSEAPAVAVAQVLQHSAIRLVLVQGKKGKIEGLIAPKDLLKTLREMRNERSASLPELIQGMLVDPQEIQRGFRHERLNERRPRFYYCELGRHYVDSRPCKIAGHEGAICAPVA